MIELNRNYHLAPRAADTIGIKIIGIGGAGCNALDRLVLDGIEAVNIVAMNTDVQSLTSSVATEKVQLGRNATRGLGAGGDPELGFAAAEEAMEEIRQALSGASLIFLCVGLGGGTGSGSAPLIANLAKEQGSLVVVFATMPFTFERARRNRQATEALTSLQQWADLVICFENDRMGDSVPAAAGIQQPFSAADQTISQSVRAICNIFRNPGLIHIGFDDLAAAVRNHNSRCLFGYGEADGDNRSNEALSRALKNPLMDKGRMLSEARNILVNVAGGSGMTLNEVQILMEELGRHIGDETQVFFGTSIDPRMGNRMSVTLISSIGVGADSHAPAAIQESVILAPEEEPPAQDLPAAAPVEQAGIECAAEAIEEEQAPALIETPEQAALIEMLEARPDEPAVIPPLKPIRPKPVIRSMPAIATPASVLPPVIKAPQQETLQFEAAARGRFEKSEPTIVDGENLDVPTFRRRNVKLK